jgi:hypothetical protein
MQAPPGHWAIRNFRDDEDNQMTLANDLVQFLMHLFRDRQAAQDFLKDPERVLEDHGLGGVCAADVDAVMPVVLDYAPVTVNASRFDRDYNTGGNSASTGHNGGGGGGYAPPPAGGGHSGGDHEHDDHAHAVQQLHHVVNNYSYTSMVDDQDTITDQSVNQNVWADGDVEQWFDNDSLVASGDRAIAAGDDADVDDSNNIEDSHNRDNSTDNSTDNSISAGRDASVGNTDTDIDGSFNTDLDLDADIDESFNDESDNSTNDSHDDESDNSVDVRDSGNDNSLNDVGNTDIDLDNVGNTTDNSDNRVDIEDVGNTENNLENIGNTTDNSVHESLAAGDVEIEYTDVQVGDIDADLTNIQDDSLIIADNDLDVTTAVAGDDAVADG